MAGKEGRALKVLTACGAGMACCMMMAMRLEKVFQKYGIKARVEHNNVAGAKGIAHTYDVVFCSKTLEKEFKRAADSGVLVIGLKNVTSVDEMDEMVRKYIVKQ